MRNLYTNHYAATRM